MHPACCQAPHAPLGALLWLQNSWYLEMGTLLVKHNFKGSFKPALLEAYSDLKGYVACSLYKINLLRVYDAMPFYECKYFGFGKSLVISYNGGPKNVLQFLLEFAHSQIYSQLCI